MDGMDGKRGGIRRGRGWKEGKGFGEDLEYVGRYGLPIHFQRRDPKTMAGPHLFYHKIRWYIFERW